MYGYVMAANLAIDPRDPDLTAGDIRELASQLDRRGVPNETPVGLRDLHVGERLVVELVAVRRTVLPKEDAPAPKRARKTTRKKAAPQA